MARRRRPASHRRALLAALLLAAPAAVLGDCPWPGHRSGTDARSLERAREILAANGITAAYRPIRLVAYESGAGMIWVQRVVRGLPVFRDALAFHFDRRHEIKRDRSGDLRPAGKGEDLARLDADEAPRIDGAAAKRIFAEHARVVRTTDPRGRPGQVLPGPDYRDRLDELVAELGFYSAAPAWRICPLGRAYPNGYVSARDGRVLRLDSGVRS